MWSNFQHSLTMLTYKKPTLLKKIPNLKLILTGGGFTKNMPWIINKKIVNHYAPTDEVLFWANKEKYVLGPLGLNGASGKPISKYQQKLVKPKNHRFASYSAVLNSFP